MNGETQKGAIKVPCWRLITKVSCLGLRIYEQLDANPGAVVRLEQIRLKWPVDDTPIVAFGLQLPPQRRKLFFQRATASDLIIVSSLLK